MSDDSVIGSVGRARSRRRDDDEDADDDARDDARDADADESTVGEDEKTREDDDDVPGTTSRCR